MGKLKGKIFWLWDGPPSIFNFKLKSDFALSENNTVQWRIFLVRILQNGEFYKNIKQFCYNFDALVVANLTKLLQFTLISMNYAHWQYDLTYQVT